MLIGLGKNIKKKFLKRRLKKHRRHKKKKHRKHPKAIKRPGQPWKGFKQFGWRKHPTAKGPNKPFRPVKRPAKTTGKGPTKPFRPVKRPAKTIDKGPRIPFRPVKRPAETKPKRKIVEAGEGFLTGTEYGK